MRASDLLIFKDGKRCDMKLVDARRVSGDEENERWEFYFDFSPTVAPREAMSFKKTLSELGVTPGSGDYGDEFRAMLLAVWNARGAQDATLVEKGVNDGLSAKEIVDLILKV